MRGPLIALLAFTLLLTPLAIPAPTLAMPQASPTLSANPSFGPPGTKFVIQGTDWYRNGLFDVKISRQSPDRAVVLVGNVPTDANGAFTYIFDSTGQIPGDYFIVVDYPPIDFGLSITITGPSGPLPGPPPSPGATEFMVTPPVGPPGTTFTMLGTGFAPDRNYFYNVRAASGDIVGNGGTATDAKGNLRFQYGPVYHQGPYTINVSVGSSDFPEGFARFSVADGAPPPPPPPPAPPPPAGDSLCFPGLTPFCITGAFRQQWETRGRLAINGYPLSDEFRQTLEDGKSYRVQYFERVRMEYHDEVADPLYQVQLGQFGRRLHPLDPPAAPAPGTTAYPAAPGPGGYHFPATKHNLSDGFLAYWQANGGLAQFGFPLSEVFTETLEDGNAYQVQYFERARFEYHGTEVLLGQFGRRVLAETPR